MACKSALIKAENTTNGRILVYKKNGKPQFALIEIVMRQIFASVVDQIGIERFCL